MKPQPSDPRPSNASSPTKRRGVLFGAAAIGAGALAARVLPTQTPDKLDATPKKPDTDTAAGYRESEHVLRYYETTRI